MTLTGGATRFEIVSYFVQLVMTPTGGATRFEIVSYIVIVSREVVDNIEKEKYEGRGRNWD